MSMNVSLHTHGDSPLKVSSSAHENTHGKFTYVKLAVGSDAVDVFLYDIADVDKLAFEFETLARELRETHGWTEKEKTV